MLVNLVPETDYISEMNYNILMLEEELFEESQIISDCINEELMNEAVAKNIGNSIKGSIKDRMIKYFKGFLAAIKGVWLRFLDNVTKLFKSNEKWIKDNLDYILNADCRNMEYVIFAYWEAEQLFDNLVNSFPKLNDNIINQISEMNCKVEPFRQLVLDKSGIGNKKVRTATASEFQEDLKALLRGSMSRKIIGRDIHKKLKYMTTFCLQYKNLQSSNKQMMNDISNNINRIINDITAKINNMKEDPNNNRENNFNESFAYDMIVLLNEESPSEKMKKDGMGSTPGEQNKLNSEFKQKQREKEEVREKTQSMNDTYNGYDQKDLNRLISCYKVYNNVHQEIFTCRLSIMEEKYKSYMKLIREVARISMGQSDAKKADTKYSANNREEQEKQKQEKRSNNQTQAKETVEKTVKKAKSTIGKFMDRFK